MGVDVLRDMLYKFELRAGESEFGYKKVSHGCGCHLLTLHIGCGRSIQCVKTNEMDGLMDVRVRGGLEEM